MRGPTVIGQRLAPSNRKSLVGGQRSSALVKPTLKWAGGKRWQLPHLRPLWDRFRDRRLVEPFCGGLAVALGLGPQCALLNDLNPHLINFYQWLKRGLKAGSLSMANSKTCYYANRRRFNRLIEAGRTHDEEAAALFYYLNRTGYNGLCRFNGSGRFNVPFGRYSKITYVRDFSAYRDTFAAWVFLNADFERIPIEAGDLIYADPPYDVEFTQYSRHPFGWDQQVRAAKWLALHNGPVILSNQATDRIVRLYQSLGFRLSFLSAPRRISCTGDRAPASEVLATRNFD